MRQRDAEATARILPPVAKNLLLKFDAQPWAYEQMPMPGRLELFQAGLLVGTTDARKRYGAKLTQLGADTQRIIRTKPHD